MLILAITIPLIILLLYENKIERGSVVGANIFTCQRSIHVTANKNDEQNQITVQSKIKLVSNTVYFTFSNIPIEFHFCNALASFLRRKENQCNIRGRIECWLHGMNLLM